ncbi:hypothetical protein SAMN04488010_0050 [Maribacter stanieri]|uniref:Uncharacterized protein n=1 Tax=Maribacter stanieri TaxID=440514 RepID=A0A1I6H8E9_9FLAO|nr:hypothetical protein SAMN04488010_0050 [Maribacter stanieri]
MIKINEIGNTGFNLAIAPKKDSYLILNETFQQGNQLNLF